MINAAREKLKNMWAVLDCSEGGTIIREGFIEEVAFELDFEGLVWFEHVEMRSKGIKSKGNILKRSGVGQAQCVLSRVNSLFGLA